MSTPLIFLAVFFFFAGLMSGRSKSLQKSLLHTAYQRFTKLIVPAVLAGLLFTILDTGSPKNFFLRFGIYWFCYTLAIYSVVILIITPIIKNVKSIWKYAVLTITGIAIISIYYLVPQVQYVYNFLNINTYLPIFLFGIAIADHRECFVTQCCRQSVITISIICFAFSLYLLFYRPITHLFLTLQFVIFSSIPIFINIGVKLGSTLSPRIKRCVMYLGKRSLSIYIIHYFFLFDVFSLQSWLDAMNWCNVPTAVITLPICAALIGASLAIDYLISLSPFLSNILTEGSIDPKPLKS